jgi:hypothetical protein
MQATPRQAESENTTMPTTTLCITSTLQITPLIDIQHEDVAHAYREGVSQSIRQSDEPVSLDSLLTCLKRAITVQVFDGHNQEAARDFVGFHLGNLHGAILTAHGTRRPDVSTLALLDSMNAQRGYRAGRHWFFEETEPHERRLTDDYMVERLEELAREAPAWNRDPERVWQFALGCLIGELSGQLFPVTHKERARWECERQHALVEFAKQDAQAVARRDTELLDSVPVVEYSV